MLGAVATRSYDVLQIGGHGLGCLLALVGGGARPLIQVRDDELVRIDLILVVSAGQRLG